MERCNMPLHHALGKCDCIISPACLREVRNRRMISLEAIAAKSGLAREYLAGVERADKGKCIDAEVIRAYEQTLGVPLEGEVLVVLHDFAHTMLACLEMFTSLHRARNDGVL